MAVGVLARQVIEVRRENIATFIAEQKEYLDKPYKRSGFLWPHLDMFKAAQEMGE